MNLDAIETTINHARIFPSCRAASLRGARPGSMPDQATTRKRASPVPQGVTNSMQRLEFEEVYERHFDFVWRSLRMLGVPPEMVEDATQDSFCVVWMQLGRFEGRSAIRTWLFAILQRVAANCRRTARRKLHPLESLSDGVVGNDSTAHAQAEASEAIDRIQDFCDTLDTEWRALFVLALVEETPGPEVAQALGIPLNTVYSRVRSLREGLRRSLGQRQSDVPKPQW